MRIAALCVLALALALPGVAQAAKPPAEVDAAKAGLRKAVAAGRISPADASRYRAILARTARALPRLGGSRHANLQGVLADVSARAPQYSAPRALTLFSMLDWNTRWFGAQGPPAPQADTVGPDHVVYRYFPGHGLQFHPLGNFAALNSLLAQGKLDEANALADALRTRGVPSGGAVVWEYQWPFGGGRAPWTSGMAQAVAAQALARAGQRFEDPSLTDLARQAYAAIPGRLVMRLSAGPWVKLYSFSRQAVFNAQLQTTVSLRDYADLSGDAAAGALADALRVAVRKALPQADTGYWTRYTLGGAEESRGYHDFVTTILGRLYVQTKDGFWSGLASKFKAYTTQPPLLQLGTSATPASHTGRGKATFTFSFWLSKLSSVALAAGGERRALTMGNGWHRLTWWLPRAKAGVFPVQVAATPVAGPRASLSLPPLVVLGAAPTDLGGLALGVSRGGAGDSGLVVGAAENAVAVADPAVSAQQLSLAVAAGLRAVRVLVPWSPGQTGVDAGVATAAQQAAAAGVRLYLEVYPASPALAPLDDASRSEFASYVGQLAAALPQVRDFVIGSRVNNPAFWPQSRSAVASYLALLAAGYDALKQVDPATQVIGGSLDSQFAPGTFILSLGQAYRPSGRGAPVMDAIALQPSSASSSEPPDAVHPSGPTTIADYARLVANLKRAFDGTAQPGATLPIVYDGYAVQSGIPPEKASLYTGSESDAVPEATQGSFYTRALQLTACQPNVAALLFGHVVDERDLSGSQSGLYYPDLTPKSDLPAVRDALAAVQAGAGAQCGGTARAVAPPIVQPAPDGRSVQIRCGPDCAYVVALVRGTAPVRARSGSAAGGTTVTLTTPSEAAVGDRLVVYAASRLNPGRAVVTEGPALTG